MHCQHHPNYAMQSRMIDVLSDLMENGSPFAGCASVWRFKILCTWLRFFCSVQNRGMKRLAYDPTPTGHSNSVLGLPALLAPANVHSPMSWLSMLTFAGPVMELAAKMLLLVRMTEVCSYMTPSLCTCWHQFAD